MKTNSWFFPVRQGSLVKGENLFCCQRPPGDTPPAATCFSTWSFSDISREEYGRLAKERSERARSARSSGGTGSSGRSRSRILPTSASRRRNLSFPGRSPAKSFPSFKATGIRGETEGKELDAIAAAAGKPQLLIFQDDNRVGFRGIYGISGALSKIVEKSEKGLSVQVVFLGDDATELSSILKRIASESSGGDHSRNKPRRPGRAPAPTGSIAMCR